MSNADFANSSNIKTIAELLREEMDDDKSVISEKEGTRALAPPPLVPPQQDDLLKVAIAKIPAFQGIESIRMPNNNAKLVKINMPMYTVPADIIAYSAIRNAYPANDAIFDVLDQTMATNNTTLSMVQRLADQLPRLEFQFRPDPSALNYMAEHLPMTSMPFEVLPPFDPSQPSTMPNPLTFNMKAGAGLPWKAKDITGENSKIGSPGVFAGSLKLALYYLKLLEIPITASNEATHAFSMYAKTNPIEFTVIMKRKAGVMPKSDLNKKSRPYGEFPLALRILFKWPTWYLKRMSLNFLQHPDSCSALGFSWVGGGAQQLIDLIAKVRQQAADNSARVFKGICFGDDQLWIFAYPSGDVVLCCPDISGMDMNLPSHFSQFLIARLKTYFSTSLGVATPPSALFNNVCRIWARMAFKHPVIMYSAVVYAKKWGLLSGIPGTTYFDQEASAYVQYFPSTLFVERGGSLISHASAVDELFKRQLDEKSFTPEGFKAVLAQVKAQVMKKTGFKFKESTLQYQHISSGQPVDKVDLPFLGMLVKSRVVLDVSGETRTEFFPVPADLDAMAVKWVYRTALAPPKVGKDKIAMARMFGLAISGAVHDDRLNAVMATEYKKWQNLGVHPAFIEDRNDLFVKHGDSLDILYEQHKDFPTKEEVISLMVRGSWAGDSMPLATVSYDAVPAGLEPADVEDFLPDNFAFAPNVAAKHLGKAFLPKPKKKKIPRSFDRDDKGRLVPKFRPGGRGKATPSEDQFDQEDDKEEVVQAIADAQETSREEWLSQVQEFIVQMRLDKEDQGSDANDVDIREMEDELYELTKDQKQAEEFDMGKLNPMFFGRDE